MLVKEGVEGFQSYTELAPTVLLTEDTVVRMYDVRSYNVQDEWQGQECGNGDWSSQLEDDHCLGGGFVFPSLLQAVGAREFPFKKLEIIKPVLPKLQGFNTMKYLTGEKGMPSTGDGLLLGYKVSEQVLLCSYMAYYRKIRK